MPDYNYEARTRAGQIEKGTISAFNEKAVSDSLRGKGLLPTSIAVVGKKTTGSSIMDSLTSVKLMDKITFIKNLSVMIKAGLPVSRALKILTEQTTNRKFSKVLAEVSRAVESGTSLADSMSKYPDIFSEIFVSMVRVGEISGNLEQNLAYLQEQLRRDYDLMSKAKGALTYPIVVVFALVLVGFLMFTFVLPKLTSTFVDLNVQLPLMTRIVIAIVDVCSKWGIFLLIGFVALVFVFLRWRKTQTGRTIMHKVYLYFPGFSSMVIKINTARFVRVFSSLIKSGLPIVESLEVSSKVVGNMYYQQAIADASSKVKVGSPLASGFKKYPHLFSPLVIQMMEVGEESGTTDTILAEVADFYETEVDQDMKNLSSIIEPMIMMVIGAVVGFLAVALVTPIYNIGNSIS